MTFENAPKKDLQGFSSNDSMLGQPIRFPGELFGGCFDTDFPGNSNFIETKFGQYVTSLHFISLRENKRESHFEKLFSS